MTNEPYERWLAQRRKASSPESMTDQIMEQVTDLNLRRKQTAWLRLVQHLERSRWARWAVCGMALSIGGLPFVFLAFATTILSF